MHATWRWLCAQWGANLRSALEYRISFVVQALAMALNNMIFLVFWAVFFARFDSVRGWDLRSVALLFGVAATGFGLGVVFLGGCLDLARRIAEGGLDTWLLRPRPVYLQAVSSRMRLSGYGDVLSGVALLFLSGFSDPARCLIFVAMALVSAVVFVAFASLCQTLAFFLGHAESLGQQGVNALISLSLYPPGIFGGAARVVLYLLVPAGLMSYTPTALVREWSFAQAGLLLLGVTVLLAVTAGAWRLGMRRYESGNLTQSLQA